MPPPERRAASPDPEPTATIADEPHVTLAAIIGAHGVNGEVRLKLFTDEADNLRAFPTLDARGRALTLQTIRPGPNGAVARFAEIVDRNGAEALRGTPLVVPRSALPPLAPGEYYHADLIGVPCVSSDGETLGEVVAVENFGAGDVIEIRRPDGRLFMVPVAAAAAVPAVPLVIDPAFITG